MKRVFVGGSRRISRLNEAVRRRLDQMVDREMRILVGDAGFMLWDGESPGTVVNVARLVGGGKSTLVWVRPRKTFLTVRTLEDLPEMLRCCSNDAEKRIMRYLAEHAPAAVQHSMF